MSEFWQQGVIAIVLLGAVAYLIRRLINWRRHRKACSECKLMKGVTVRAGEKSERTGAN